MIHSFWVPELNRKIDVIPGRTNDVIVSTRGPRGTYRGQCAEFCGLQHAHMALYVVAEPRDAVRRVARRADAARAAAARPPMLERGQQIFLGSACEYCHTIAGTNASGTIGPDLTHLASRLSIGAGDDPEHRGLSRGLDPRSAARQAGQQHARRPHLSGAGAASAARLSGEPALMAASSVERLRARVGGAGRPRRRARDRRPQADRHSLPASPRLSSSCSAASRRCDARPARPARTSSCSRPRRTTSSSRCTA